MKTLKFYNLGARLIWVNNSDEIICFQARFIPKLIYTHMI